jgi:hypothetical protein
MTETASDLLARRIFAEFKAKPESQHIASEFALIQLSRLIGRIKPRNVLEIGAGIGTITKLLLEHPDRPARVTASESHPVCLRELGTNLMGSDLAGLKLIHSAAELETGEIFDLVIFDGSLDEDTQYEVLREGSWCFIEGERRKTIDALQVKLRQRGLILDYRVEQPAGRRTGFLSKRRVLGFRLPALKVRRPKGCSIGQIIRTA